MSSLVLPGTSTDAASTGQLQAPDWPCEVTLAHAVEDVIAAARIEPGTLDLDALEVAADRLADLVGSLQERRRA